MKIKSDIAGDLIALLCIFLLGIAIIVGGTAYGVAHYKHYQQVRE